MQAGPRARPNTYRYMIIYMCPTTASARSRRRESVEAPFNGDYNDAATTALAASSTTTVATRDGRPDGPQLHLIVNDPT